MLHLPGEFSNGKQAYLYLSNINFEATYSFVEKGSFQLSMYRLYAINYMDSQHPEICRAQKEWIQSLKRYSTLISQSGEIQRMIYFTKQREIVGYIIGFAYILMYGKGTLTWLFLHRVSV